MLAVLLIIKNDNKDQRHNKLMENVLVTQSQLKGWVRKQELRII